MEEIREQPTKTEHKVSRALGRAFRFNMLLPEVTWLAEKRVKLTFRDSENQVREDIEIIGELHWRAHNTTYEGDIPEDVIRGICSRINDQEAINSKKRAKTK